MKLCAHCFQLQDTLGQTAVVPLRKICARIPELGGQPERRRRVEEGSFVDGVAKGVFYFQAKQHPGLTIVKGCPRGVAVIRGDGSEQSSLGAQAAQGQVHSLARISDGNQSL